MLPGVSARLGPAKVSDRWRITEIDLFPHQSTRIKPPHIWPSMRQVAIWRRPKLIARGDPAHDHMVAGIVARLIELPRRAVVVAEDETHLHLLPHVRASWTLRGTRPKVAT